ncbi:MAG: hypothetical protein V2A73_17415 [Pseudomonadota bacterium]
MLYVVEVQVGEGEAAQWLPMLDLPQGIAVSDDKARANKVRTRVNQSLAFKRKTRVAEYVHKEDALSLGLDSVIALIEERRPKAKPDTTKEELCKIKATGP